MKNFFQTYSKRQSERGFTLIELLVVIAIIAILVLIVLIAINPAEAIKKSQDARRRSDLQAIRTALQLYYNDQKAFPASLSFGGQLTDGGSTVYMKQVPNDPLSGSTYAYKPTCAPTCTDYVVGAVLKAANTPTTDDTNTLVKCSGGTGIPVGSGTATYEVCND